MWWSLATLVAVSPELPQIAALIGTGFDADGRLLSVFASLVWFLQAEKLQTAAEESHGAEPGMGDGDRLAICLLGKQATEIK